MIMTLRVADATRIWTKDGHVESRVKELWQGRKTLDLVEILDLDIPLRDRLWLLVHGDVLPLQVHALLNCRFAKHTLPIFERQVPDDPRPREALAVAYKYVNEEVPHEEKEVAYNEALDASHSGGGSDIDAASMAAYAVAQAVGGSVLGASRGAVSAAELDAAQDYPDEASKAAKAAEEVWQTEQIKEIVARYWEK